MEEIWKDIEGYIGFYQVSNYGRIKRLEHTDKAGHTYKERIVKCGDGGRGYLRVHLSRDGIAKWHQVHRIVAKAFVPQKENCDIVNHLDNNPSNNRYDNLEWTDYKGNMQHAAKQGRMRYNPQNLLKAQLSKEIPVFAIIDGVSTWYKSAAEAARVLNISSSHIAAACRKEYGYKTVSGYEWKYADEELQTKQAPHKVGISKQQWSEIMRSRMTGNKFGLGKKTSDETKRIISQRLSKAVIQFAKSGEIVAEFPSTKVAQEKTRISHIADCCNGKRHTAGGYIWKYKKEVIKND